AFVVVVYLPGRALLRPLRLPTSPLEHLMLASALGVPASSLAYWLCAYAQAPGAFPAFLGLAAVAALWGARSGAGGLAGRVRGAHVLLLLAVLLATSLIAFQPLLFQNLARRTDGGIGFHAVSDAVLHLSIANELRHTVPPQNPFLPGRPLSYHYGVDL